MFGIVFFSFRMFFQHALFLDMQGLIYLQGVGFRNYEYYGMSEYDSCGLLYMDRVLDLLVLCYSLALEV